jgi:hypothetical protein
VLAKRGSLQHHSDVEGKAAPQEASDGGRAQHITGSKLHRGTCVAHRLSTLIERFVGNEEGDE